MNEIIRKRKSIRKYESAAMDDAGLDRVREKIESLTPLFPEVKYSVEIVDKTKWLFAANFAAPHFLVFRSEKKEGGYENIGFVGQQMDLYFSENGIGSCWLGMAKPHEKGEMPYVISMAFGMPAEPLHRSLSEFNRKALSEISEGSDERLEAARLAPSGINTQGWFFSAADGKIRCYRKKPAFFLAKLSCIDIGIAICHIASESDIFRISKEPDAPERKGYAYVATVV